MAEDGVGDEGDIRPEALTEAELATSINDVRRFCLRSRSKLVHCPPQLEATFGFKSDPSGTVMTRWRIRDRWPFNFSLPRLLWSRMTSVEI